MNHKRAGFIAGDKNVIKPGIIALSSVRKYNPNLDLFLVTHLNDIDRISKKIAKKLDIKLIDIKAVDSEKMIDNFGKLKKNNRWPKELYAQYLTPIFLYKMGYQHAIKLDYDMLCVAKYEEYLFDATYDIQAVKTINYMGNNINVSKEFEKQMKINNFNGINVGFIVFNTETYVKKQILDRYLEIYAFFKKRMTNIPAAEQFIFSYLISLKEISFRSLEEKYNYTIYVRNYNNQIRNIHYITTLKPWSHLTKAKLKLGKRGGHYINFEVFEDYYQYVLNEANYYEEINEIVKSNLEKHFILLGYRTNLFLS